MKLYNGVYMPFYLRLTNTVNVNEREEERTKTEYQQHKSPQETFHLLTNKERERDKADG